MASSRRSSRRLARAFGLACVVVLSAGCGSHQSAPAPVKVGVPLYAGMQGHSGISPATAASVARSVRLIVATPRQLAALAPAIQRARPGIATEIYVNAMLVHPDEASTYPSSWYLHDAAGGLVRSRGQDNVLMNPASTAVYQGVHGWAEWVAHQCKAALATFANARGCFLDMTGPAPLRSHYDVNGAVPVDPATGRPFRESDYLAQTAALSHLVERVSGRPVISNGIESGEHWAAGTRALLAGAHGFEIEHWLGLGQMQTHTLAGWQANIAAVMELARLHRTTLVGVDTVAGQTDRSLEFALASFLLAAGQGQYLQIGGPTHAQPSWQLRPPVYSVALGRPSTTASGPEGYRHGGLYLRKFQHGLVVVNPGDTAQPYKPPSGYTPAPGTPLPSGDIPPLTGVIMVRSS